MDILFSVILVGILLVYQPGNKELNTYCKKAVEEKTFQTRMECWNYYKDVRDFPKD